MNHRHEGRGIVGRAVGDPHAELDHQRIVDQPLLDQILDHDEMAGVEDLELGPHAERLDALRHGAQGVGRVDHDIVAAGGEIHRAAIERADLGQQLLDMGKPLGRAGHVGAGRVGRQRLLDRAEHEIAAHPGGQVEHDIGARGAHPVDHLGVELGVARALAGARIADMDMGDRGAGLGRLDGGIGDLLLLRRHRHLFRLARRVARPGHRAGDEDFPIHRHDPFASRPRVAAILAQLSRSPDAPFAWNRQNLIESDGADLPCRGACWW